MTSHCSNDVKVTYTHQTKSNHGKNSSFFWKQKSEKLAHPCY